MDVRRLAFRDESLDAVLDKATFDAVLCAQDRLWAAQLVQEVYRVLRPGGTYLMISLNSPDEVLPFLVEELMWTAANITTATDAEGSVNHVYVCRKLSSALLVDVASRFAFANDWRSPEVLLVPKALARLSPKTLASCQARRCCTFEFTGHRYMPQRSYTCSCMLRCEVLLRQVDL